jgi:hypothetical protein
MAAPLGQTIGWRPLRRVAAVTAVLTGLTPLVARPAWAAATVAPDSVVVVSDPGVRLVAPGDGRLRGDHLAAIVTGVAFAAHVGFGPSVQQAARGQRLVVFGVQGAHVGQTFDAAGKTIPPVTATLIVDGQRSALPVPDHDDGGAPVYYRGSVPSAAREVEVELAASGLAQRFSLTTGVRVGVQPVVLYRDRIAARPVDQVNGEQDLATPDPADNLAGATVPIRVHDVYLAWFGPDSPADVPALPDQAWLVVDASSENDSTSFDFLHYLTGLSAAQVTLTLPGGRTVTSQLLKPGTGETGTGVFDGIYDFAVPADMTAATLTVGPAAFEATVAFSGSTPVTVATRGQASFPITFPAPYQPPPAPPAVAAGPDSQPAAAPSPARNSGGGGVKPAIPIVAVALLLAGAGVALTRRRHRAAVPATLAAEGGGAAGTSSTAIAPDPAAAPRTATPSRPGPGPDHRLGREEVPVAPVPSGFAAPPVVISPPVLAPIPSGTPVPPNGLLYFELLGPFRIAGWPDDQARSTPVLDLATYLAVHPERAYTAEELRDPLSIGKPRALGADTIRTYANTLRRTVGADHLPDAGRQGYTLSASGTDWHRFVERSSSAPRDKEPADEARSLADALALVRGAPFAELPSNGFGWVATELLVSRVEVAVIAAAGRLVDLALAAGDWPLASWAAERGLVVSPTTQELNASTLHAAARSRQPDRLAQAWRDVTRRYAAADDPVPDELVQLHDQLRRPV